MKLTVEPKRPNKKGLWYLKDNNEIIKRRFNKKKLLALKQQLEKGVIDINDLEYNTILESDIKLWMDELWKKENLQDSIQKKKI